MSVRYLRISVTDRCNLRCAYCSPMKTVAGAPREDLLTYEEIGKVARLAVSMGVQKVRVTGGEPLRRPGIEWLLGDLASIPGIQDRGVTTNGTNLSRFVPVLADGGFRVNVHLDTLDPARYRTTCGGGSPAEVLEGIEAALAAGIRLKINSVCTPATSPEDALALVRYGTGRGIEVRFIEAMPVEGLPGGEAAVAMAGLEAFLRKALGLAPTGLEGVCRTFHVPGTTVRVGFITPSHARFCAGCNKLRLSSRGRLRTCLFAESGIDLRELLRAGDDFGLRQAVAEAMDRKKAGEGREGCAIRTMIGIGG